MPDFEAQLKALGQRTDDALGSLEQHDQWAEALAIYRTAGAEVEALGLRRGDSAYKAAQKVRAYL